MFRGEGYQIIEEVIPDGSSNCNRLFGQRLRGDHDRSQVIMKMRQVMVKKFKDSV